VRFGHERRATLLAAGDEADPVTVGVEPVQHRQVALPGDAERDLDALREQAFDDERTSRRGHASSAIGNGSTS
jgi:DNA-binding transcriptional regulator YbjK